MDRWKFRPWIIGQLNDTIMDTCPAVLRQQFPHQQGMQSVLYAVKPEFPPVSGQFVQLIITNPNDGGLHWICFSNFNCDDGIVNLYELTGHRLYCVLFFIGL